jgi:hypothetical protein
MDVNTIDKKRNVGDFRTASQMTGMTSEACRMAWSRKSGKPFEKVKKALEAIIESREQLIASNNN